MGCQAGLAPPSHVAECEPSTPCTSSGSLGCCLVPTPAGARALPAGGGHTAASEAHLSVAHMMAAALQACFGWQRDVLLIFAHAFNTQSSWSVVLCCMHLPPRGRRKKHVCTCLIGSTQAMYLSRQRSGKRRYGASTCWMWACEWLLAKSTVKQADCFDFR